MLRFIALILFILTSVLFFVADFTDAHIALDLMLGLGFAGLACLAASDATWPART